MNISLVNDVLGEYEVIEGKPRITIRSANALKYRGFYACTVRLTFMRHNSRDVYGVEPRYRQVRPCTGGRQDKGRRQDPHLHGLDGQPFPLDGFP